ncbi:maleylpyruvate isomerase family mycothiol-dependent enzyme [Streptomyces sp. NPDC057249]|uniref:maleylpyruvate isomerase family mycothiol-dependent enzyme n=1 Tax=Streptomyces sp. NPDC057249 TaxID=3346067 RepID=UPI00362F213F
MTPPHDFTGLLRLIDERSAAFRAAMASAPGFDAPVPGCPGWNLYDLAQHLGGGDRYWADVIKTGPAAAPPADALVVRAALVAPRDPEALVAWLAESTRVLLDALRDAGPERGCWTWWAGSRTPQNAWGVARHRVQESAVHTYDAQRALGVPEPLPEEVGLDGVEEFLFTCVATPSAWPHAPTAFDFHASEGRSWRVVVDADGARPARVPAPTAEGAGTAGVAARGPAGDLVLYLYNRIPAEALRIDGDRRLLDLLRDWEPEE